LQGSLNFDCQALPGVLLQDGKNFERTPIKGSVRHEIIGPYMIRPAGLQTNTRSVLEPQASAFRLFVWHFQTLLSPDPLNPLMVYLPSGVSQQRRDPAIPIAAILTGQQNDRPGQGIFLFVMNRAMSLR
jgi:hypothetical protein